MHFLCLELLQPLQQVFRIEAPRLNGRQADLGEIGASWCFKRECAPVKPGAVVKEDRSLMNVPFVSPSKEQDAEVVAASKEAGFDNLKGHKSVGGLRASIYNAMPKEGVEALVEFLRKYEAEHA